MSSLSRGTKAELFSILPAGTVLPFAGATAPAGWAICDGTAISRTDYPELFLAIGETWGNGDGSTTFHLPDMRGRFMRGVDAGAGRDADSGSRAAANAGGNTGDAVGSAQDDAFQRTQGGLRLQSVWWQSGWDTGVFVDTGSNGNGSHFGSGNVTYPNIRFDSADSDGPNTPKSSDSETRSKNVNINYIIKL